MAKGDGVVDHFEPIDHLRGDPAANRRITHLKSEHSIGVRHLRQGEVVLRMRREAGIDDFRHPWIRLEPFCDCHCSGFVRFHA